MQQIKVAFENVYNAGSVPSLTGDNDSIGLYMVLMLISGAGMVVLFRKQIRVK